MTLSHNHSICTPDMLGAMERALIKSQAHQIKCLVLLSICCVTVVKLFITFCFYFPICQMGTTLPIMQSCYEDEIFHVCKSQQPQEWLTCFRGFSCAKIGVYDFTQIIQCHPHPYPKVGVIRSILLMRLREVSCSGELCEISMLWVKIVNCHQFHMVRPDSLPTLPREKVAKPGL